MDTDNNDGPVNIVNIIVFVNNNILKGLRNMPINWEKCDGEFLINICTELQSDLQNTTLWSVSVHCIVDNTTVLQCTQHYSYSE